MKTIVLDAAKIRESSSDEWAGLTAMKGESAYEIAVRRGDFTGTEEQWTNALMNEREEALDMISNSGSAALNSIEYKRVSTLASIPDNYTDFQEEVNDALDNKIVVSATEPTSTDTVVWYDTSDTSTDQIPEIDDAHTSDVDTWSSNKISSELSSLSDENADMVDALLDISEATGKRTIVWQEGAIQTGTGEDATSTYYRIRTKNQLLLPVTVTVGSTAKILAVYFNANHEYVSSTNWMTNGTYTFENAGAKYARLLCGYSNDATTGELDTLAALFTIDDYAYSTVSKVISSGLFNINDCLHNQGWIGSGGTWANITSNWIHAVIPVSPGDVIKSKGSQIGYIAFVKSYSGATSGASVDFSAVEGYTSRIDLTANTAYSNTAPADAVYAIISTTYSGTVNEFDILTINGYNLLVSARETISSVSGLVHNSELFTIDDCLHGQGWINSSNVWANITANWLYAVVPVSSGDVIKIKGSQVGCIAFVKSYSEAVNGEAPDFSTVSGYTEKFSLSANTGYSYAAPADAAYAIISTTYSGAANVFEYLTINGYDLLVSARENISNLSGALISSKPVWYALGDSITEGYTSANGTIGPVTSLNYVYYVALYNGYQATNYAVGGSGYNHEGTVGDKKNARDHVASIDFSGCDLCTLAYGVNDWHYSCEIGTVNDNPATGGTMASNMKYCIEKILTDNPLCKIIILLPMNNSAFGTGNTEENNWGLGATMPTSGTLQDVIDVEKAICDYYGIEYIDQSKTSVVNRYNIQTLLNDGTHPIESAYKAIGANLAKQIHFA